MTESRKIARELLRTMPAVCPCLSCMEEGVDRIACALDAAKRGALDAAKRGALKTVHKCEIEGVEEFKLLGELYQKIWCEAGYDPLSESSRKFANTLLPIINKLNDLLKFHL